MTTTPKPEPASDAEMDRMEGMIGLDFPIPAMLSIFHRHRADRATIAKQAEMLNLIADLSDGWDEDGSTGPKGPLSWETVARLALDYARAALPDAPKTRKASR